jgi:F-type H+-transporting ATPase subunit b
VLTAVVIQTGNSIQVRLGSTGLHSVEVVSAEGSEVEKPEKDLNPIFPEVKEMLWGFGSFAVFAILMRYFLYPRLKAGTDARYKMIRDNVEGADAARAAAQAEVADYQRELASVRTEAAGRVEAVRQTLESERSEKLAEVNARIAERRAAASADAEAARVAVRDQIEAAVSTVSSRATELAIGKAPSALAVRQAVTDAMSVGVAK